MNKKIMSIGAIILLGGIGFGVYTYMQSQKDATIEALGPVTEPVTGQMYTLAEVAQHATPSDCWIVIHNKVYDATKFIDSGIHNPQILQGCGKDASVMASQEREHQGDEAQEIMAKLYIGDLSQ